MSEKIVIRKDWREIEGWFNEADARIFMIAVRWAP